MRREGLSAAVPADFMFSQLTPKHIKLKRVSRQTAADNIRSFLEARIADQERAKAG